MHEIQDLIKITLKHILVHYKSLAVFRQKTEVIMELYIITYKNLNLNSNSKKLSMCSANCI